MSRIILISPWAPPSDGVAFHSHSIAASWRAAGHDVLIVASGSQAPKVTSASSDVSGIRVLRTLRPIPRRATARLLSEFRPDVVIVQFAIASQNTALISTLMLMRAARRNAIAVVSAFHEPAREIDRLGALSRWIYRAAARVTTHPVAYSRSGADALRNAGIFAHVHELPLGCRIVTPMSPEDLARIKGRYAVASPLVLSVGFVHPDKGTDLLVESMPKITLLLEGNVKFLIAGSPRTRRGIFRLMGRGDRRFHERLIRKVSLLTNVSADFCDFVPNEDLYPLLFFASAIVLPYRRATQSAVASEALGARGVIVASDLPELVDDLGRAASYFRAGNVDDLTETLVSVLRNPQTELRDAAASRAAERGYDATASGLLTIGLAGTDLSQ
jgi:glycosyltransferase involved in cell wall biosynthesis